MLVNDMFIGLLLTGLLVAGYVLQV